MFATTILRQAPFALTTLRWMLAPVVLFIAAGTGNRAGLVGCLLAGFLSDIFDGILARRLGIATPALRRYDSAADVIFYTAIFGAIGIAHPQVVRDHVWGLAVLGILELACNAVSWIRFNRAPATHAYAAKLWGIFLFAACTALLGFGIAGGIFSAMILMGFIADVEVIAIMLVSRTAPVDIPSLFHALQLRGQAHLEIPYQS